MFEPIPPGNGFRLFGPSTSERLRSLSLSVFEEGSGAQLRVVLPPSWAQAPASSLLRLLARRVGKEAESLHLVSRRGPLVPGLPLVAQAVHRETLWLRAGRPPVEEQRRRTQLWVWGRRVDGSVSELPTLQPGLGAHTVSEVALGAEHALAVTCGGLALSWGHNGYGQLGTGNEVPRALPAVVRALSSTRCARPFCGLHCSAIVDALGSLWTWGEHQPANGPTIFHTSWVNRHGATTCGLGVSELSFGSAHAVLLTREGAVWTWGYNAMHCLGWASAAAAGPHSALRHGFQKPHEPLQLPPALQVAAGALHSAAVVAGGLLYAWGDNSLGQCGGGGGGTIPMPLPVAAFDAPTEAVARVRCVAGTTIVITQQGRCYLLGGGSPVEVASSDEEEEEEDDDEDDTDMGSPGSGASDAEMEVSQDASAAGSHPDGAPPGTPSLSALHGSLPGGLGLKRLLIEGVADVAPSADHALLLGALGGRSALGMGYNRYGQALPGSRRLRLGAPRRIDAQLFSGARLLQVAAGGGGSAALSDGEESLSMRCTSALLGALRSSDVGVCIQFLEWNTRCSAPGLGLVARQCLECVAANRASVERAWRAEGLSAAQLRSAIAALENASDADASAESS